MNNFRLSKCEFERCPTRQFVRRSTRVALRDFQLWGKRIRESDRARWWVISANRDEAAFPQADTFDITRTHKSASHVRGRFVLLSRRRDRQDGGAGGLRHARAALTGVSSGKRGGSRLPFISVATIARAASHRVFVIEGQRSWATLPTAALAMTERVDFSGNAPVYDRRHGAFMAERIVSQLLEVTGLPIGAQILDVGEGAGRAAIPFAQEGYSVVAVDAALAMLASLRQKSGDARVPAVVGDGTLLPFAVHSFDAAVIARLLYLSPTGGAAARNAPRP